MGALRGAAVSLHSINFQQTHTTTFHRREPPHMMTVQKELKSNSPQDQAAVPGQVQKEDYTHRYWESTQETLVGLYAKRDSKTGLPVETVNDIIHRVATSVAIAELKYALSPQELIDIELETALISMRIPR
jgi:hypothetical protein